MGNRANLKFKYNNQIRPIGIYLHWNGGRESIEGFLMAARKLEINSRACDYAITRFAQMIANFFGGMLSIEICPVNAMPDAWDNGTYIIDESTFRIIEKEGEEFNPEDEYDTEAAELIYSQCIEINQLIFNS